VPNCRLQRPRRQTTGAPLRLAFGFLRVPAVMDDSVDRSSSRAASSWRSRVKSASVGVIFSYSHLPVIAYVALTYSVPGLWIVAAIPQLGMAMPFLPLVIALLVCGAALFAPGDPIGLLSTTFPGGAGAALIAIPTFLSFGSFYTLALFRVFPTTKLSRGWAAFLMLWSVSTNLGMIPMLQRLNNERALVRLNHGQANVQP